MKTHIALACLLATCSVVGSSYAQERSAGGNLSTEASWNALKSLINKVEGDVATQKILLNALADCNKEGKLYSPGMSGADSKGCRPTGAAAAAAPTPSRGLTAIGGGNCSPTWCPSTQSTHCGGGSSGCPSTWSFWGVGQPGGCAEGSSSYGNDGYSFTCTGYR